MKKNTLVGQSGSPTAIINASLYEAVAEGMARPEEVDHIYGMINDIEGSLSGRVTNPSLLTREGLNLLKRTPAAYLGSCHLKLPKNLDTPVYSLLFEKFTTMNIGARFYIGGDDPMDTVDKLSRYTRIRRETISFMRMPKTMNNDLPVTNHTLGYGSAAEYMASMTREISLGASAHQQPAVTIVELMGCHASWVTAAGALAKKYPGDNPLLTYMPRVPLSMERFFKDMEQALSRQPNVVICVPEDIRDKKGHLICEYTNDVRINTFNYEMLTDCAEMLESYVRSRFRIKVRSIELDVNQRYSGLLASAADMEGAECLGRRAAEKALQGETGKIVTCSRLSGPGYEPEYGLIEVGNVCNREKSFPTEWIAAEGSDIGPEFLDYALPLIQRQPDHIMEDGLPKYLYRR